MSDSESGSDVSDGEEPQFDFEGGDAGAQQTFPVRAGKIKKGSFIEIDGHPCKVVDVSTSKTGKHGHAKASIVGLDIFTDKKYEVVSPTSHNVMVPVIKRVEYQLIDVDDEGYVSLMDEQGNSKDHLKLPEGDLGDHIREAQESGKSEVYCTVLSSMGNEMIVDYKEV